jgi:hypothetical protein
MSEFYLHIIALELAIMTGVLISIFIVMVRK